MAREHSKHAIQGIRAHIDGSHQTELGKAGGNYNELYRVIKDPGGRRDEKESDENEEHEPDNTKKGKSDIEEKETGDYKQISYSLLQKIGLPERSVKPIIDSLFTY